MDSNATKKKKKKKSKKNRKLLMLSQVQEIVPYSASHIWRLERLGLFPGRIRLGGNRIAWLEAEVNGCVEAKVAARNSDSHY